MHPIEHLRYLARDGDPDPRWVVPEAAAALRSLTADRHALVMAARTLVRPLARCGPLWWLTAHLLAATDPRTRIDELLDEFTADPTGLQVSLALADVSEDPVVVDAWIVSSTGSAITDRRGLHGSSTTNRPIWVSAGVGTVVDDRYFAVARSGTTGDSVEVLDPARVDRWIRPTGSGSRVGRPDAPFIPELLGRA